ncbi:MAG TPA: ANTAR domain-containing protein [Jatrophihabitantaceae bacterium]|nr:ANTAR domain-containing protein [Jatrophihabitantaceae bacterium]
MRPVTELHPDPDHDECQHRLTESYEKIRELETALITSRRIGTAVGIVMATYKVTDEAAFDLLVMASQNGHVKLREIAQQVIDTGELKWTPTPVERRR